MNKYQGVITQVESDGALSIVHVDVKGQHFSAIIIDTPVSKPYLKSGSSVYVIFKETEVVIGKEVEGHISLRNKINGKISKIEKGALLSKVTIQSVLGDITSIITTNAVSAMGLERGDDVQAMIKTNEVMLSPVGANDVKSGA